MVDGFEQDEGTYCKDFALIAGTYDCPFGFEATVIGGECGGISSASIGDESTSNNSVIMLAIFIPVVLMVVGVLVYKQQKDREGGSSALPAPTRVAQGITRPQLQEVTAVPLRLEQPLPASKDSPHRPPSQTNENAGRISNEATDDDSYC